ncbi:hypothetical protein AB6B38_05595 [Glycocaulis abyssi]|uniref:hypothetical protein n=1 Tax=Glycocaulis abyssi TaxID=1433403 RepID=UPI00352B76E4
MTENVPASSGDWWKRPWVAVTVVSALICIAAVTSAITAYYAESRQQADRAADQYRAYAERVVACDGIESRAEHYACLVEAVQTEQQRLYAATNLRAQQDMSTWSFATLWISLGLLIVTGVGVTYVALTLDQTRRATKAAVKAAEAAENTVLETRRIGEAQVRAYITVRHTNSFSKIESNKKHVLVKEIINTGSTPAYNVSYAASLFVADDHFFPDENFWPEHDFNLHGQKAYIANGSPSFVVGDIFLEHKIAMNIYAGHSSIFAACKIEYFDAFNRCHTANIISKLLFVPTDEKDSDGNPVVEPRMAALPGANTYSIDVDSGG